jgi:hypothetical protein
MAKSPAPTSRNTRNEPPRLRSSTTRSGSIGLRARVSKNTKATSSTTAAIRKVSVLGSPQPCTSVELRSSGFFSRAASVKP